jgi:hypothetical protein
LIKFIGNLFIIHQKLNKTKRDQGFSQINWKNSLMLSDIVRTSDKDLTCLGGLGLSGEGGPGLSGDGGPGLLGEGGPGLSGDGGPGLSFLDGLSLVTLAPFSTPVHHA